MLRELLEEAQALGIDISKIELPQDDGMPRAIVEQLRDIGRRRSCNPHHAHGYLDLVEGRQVCGWAFHPGDPNAAEAVDVFVDGVFVLQVAATEFRADLLQAGIGNGHHSFAIDLPPKVVDSRTHEVAVRFATTGVDLVGSPTTKNLC
jgi:hypothetical protein